MSDFLFVGRYSIYTLDYTVVNASNFAVAADAPPIAVFHNYANDATVFTRAFTGTVSLGVYRLILSSVETATPGLWYIIVTYNLGGIPQTYRIDIEIPVSTSSVYESLTNEARGVVDSVWWRFADMFDSALGGPHLKEYAQSNFGRETLGQLYTLALNHLNTSAQPTQSFSVLANDFPFAQFGGLLELGVYIEAIKHLIRSYVEQPEAMNVTTARLDRRDYMQRWADVLAIELDDYKRQLAVFKMYFLGLGNSAVLISGGLWGEYAASVPVTRPRIRLPLGPRW